MIGDPQRTLIAATLVTAGILTWRNLSAGDLHPRSYAALVVVTLILMVVAALGAPELAAAFAVLLAIGVFMSGGRNLASLPTK